jgi:hypothetical protein
MWREGVAVAVEGSQVASCGVTDSPALSSALQGRHLASVRLGLVLEDQADRLL